MSAFAQFEHVHQAWAALAGVPSLARFQVVVSSQSPLCPPGWIGVLVIEETVTVCVPDPDLIGVVRSELGALSPTHATDPDAVLSALPSTAKVLGPAGLFYPPPGTLFASCGAVEELGRADLRELIAALHPGEADEAGIGSITSPAFGLRDDGGELAAACGWRLWPYGIAHLCVATHPAHRRRGRGRAVARAAIGRAAESGLLPQWRARPLGSQRLAQSIGLTKVGAQLSVRIG